jgi:UDP-N-acetylglucosamine 2-epimerase (non-hydrolysing)/GDP/UDP-N,N'-diacetylbacillosamine 2-epimerase (hydrolysing)
MIGVVTVARSDYGIYVPLLRALQAADGLALALFVGGMHLSPDFGLTVRAIEADGYPIAARVAMALTADTPADIARSMGLGVAGFAGAFARSRPDILVVLGDRFEMHAAALAALPFKLPVAHIHGGELTYGAMDDALRHSMTKLSHLHFTATEAYARRVIQLGEEPWRVTVSGAPGLDNLRTVELLSRAEIEARYTLRLDEPFLIVTYHPVTLEFERTAWQTGEMLAALDETQMPIVFTLPNADTAGRLITELLRGFVAAHPRCRLVDNLGTQGYFSLMALAAAMVGNSSSGLLEAPSFQLPVVNIGNRQAGRVRAANVLDVGYNRAEIEAGIRRAVAPGFRAGLAALTNPYGDGHAAGRIVERLKAVALDDRLLVKRFFDLGRAGGREERP